MVNEESKDIQTIDFKKLPVDFSSIDVTDEALSMLKEKYGQVPDCSTKEGYAIAKEGLAIFRTLRSKVEARRKELNSDAVDYKKRVDFEAKRITEFVVAIEEPLKEARQAEDEVKAEEKRLAAEKEEKRVAAIENDINTIRNVILDCHGKTSFELLGIIQALNATEIEMERFAEHTPVAEAAKIEAVKKLEELREQAMENEKADEDRKAEDARLAEERRKFEDEQAEAKRVADIKAKVQAIKDRGAYDPEATADQILGRINVLENTQPSKDVFEEFTEEAHMAVGIALGALKDFHVFAADKERLAAIAAEEALEEKEEAPLEEPIKEEPIEEAATDDSDVVDAEFNPEDQAPSSGDGDMTSGINEREIAVNFFIIKNVKELQDGYFRVTLENQYVGTEDTDLIMAFSSTPETGQKVQLVMEAC